MYKEGREDAFNSSCSNSLRLPYTVYEIAKKFTSPQGGDSKTLNTSY